LLLTALCIGGLASANVGFADVHCTGNACNFTNLTTQQDKNPFYCKTTGKITHIMLSNHSVLITGFNKQGKFRLDGTDVDLLAKYYFDAIRDNNSTGSVELVEVTGEGKVICKEGKGGRVEKRTGDY